MAHDEPRDLADELSLVADRDDVALQRLYSATAGKLRAICLRVTGDPTLVDDVLQETFIKIWNHAGDFDRARAQPMTWLARIARNTAIDAVRGAARRRAAPLADAPERVDEAPLADVDLIHRERISSAMTAVEALSDQQKEIIRGLFFEGMTYAEMAERDGIPTATVKTRTHRLLSRLGKKLSDG